MKKKLVMVLSVLLLVALAASAAAIRYLTPTGQITAFDYGGGHPWYYYYHYSLEVSGGQAWAVETYTPGDIWGDADDPYERRRPLTEEEHRAFERLILRELRLCSWPEETGPSPAEITDQDSWWITFTCDGEQYQENGYAEFPHGLQKIADFLTVPETP